MEYVWYVVVGLIGLTFAFGLRNTYRDVHEKLVVLQSRPVSRTIVSIVLTPICYVVLLIGCIVLLPFVFLWNLVAPSPKAVEPPKKPKKKSRPLFGSRQIEAMFLDKHADNPLARKAARKARDTIFRL